MGHIIYVNTVSATTAGPSIVPRAITPSRQLRARTGLTVLYPDGESYGLDLYRLSSAKPGAYSREIYRLEDGRWRLTRKDERKYENRELPWPPGGAVEEEVSGVRIWTMAAMDEAEKGRLQKIMEILPKGE